VPEVQRCLSEFLNILLSLASGKKRVFHSLKKKKKIKKKEKKKKNKKKETLRFLVFGFFSAVCRRV